MKIKSNAGGQPPGAGTARADFLRTLLKRLVMALHIDGLLSHAVVARVFSLIDMRAA